jgi:hypothetical protein
MMRTGELIELNFSSRSRFDNPYKEVELSVEFTSEQGETFTVPGFWDGNSDWRVRFTPFTAGHWRWKSSSNLVEDTRLHGKTGEVEVITYQGENAVKKHGFLKVSGNCRGFEHSDGTPFFWLGDTAWGAPAKASMAEWEKYLTYRKKQGFNLIQANVLPQFDASGTDFRIPFTGDETKWDLYRLNPEYFCYLDRLVQFAYDAGILMAMVILHFTCVPTSRKNLEVRRVAAFTTETAELLGKYLAARYSAFGAVWIVSGDSDFEDEETIAVYDAAARAVRKNSPYKPLVTSHLYPSCDAKSFSDKEWLNFYMFQSAHIVKSKENALALTENARRHLREMPVMNGEPCYENMGYFDGPGRVDRITLRNTAWFSILGGANAGITYGAHGVWPWHREGERYEWNHTTLMPADWEEALGMEGAGDYIRMKEFFQKLLWWELVPLRVECDADAAGSAVCSATGDRSTIIAYTTEAAEFAIPTGNDASYEGVWFHPATGEEWNCRMKSENGKISIPASSENSGEMVLLLGLQKTGNKRVDK